MVGAPYPQPIVEIGDTVTVNYGTHDKRKITGQVRDRGFGLEVDNILLEHPNTEILEHRKPVVEPPKPVVSKDNVNRQVIDQHGVLTSVSVADDRDIVIDDLFSDLQRTFAQTRRYDVATARKHAQQILDRCNRIEQLLAYVEADGKRVEVEW